MRAWRVLLALPQQRRGSQSTVFRSGRLPAAQSVLVLQQATPISAVHFPASLHRLPTRRHVAVLPQAVAGSAQVAPLPSFVQTLTVELPAQAGGASQRGLPVSGMEVGQNLWRFHLQ